MTLALSNPLARWLRDQLLPVPLKRFANAGAHAWLYRYHVDWDEPVAAGASALMARR